MMMMDLVLVMMIALLVWSYKQTLSKTEGGDEVGNEAASVNLSDIGLVRSFALTESSPIDSRRINLQKKGVGEQREALTTDIRELDSNVERMALKMAEGDTLVSDMDEIFDRVSADISRCSEVSSAFPRIREVAGEIVVAVEGERQRVDDEIAELKRWMEDALERFREVSDWMRV